MSLAADEQGKVFDRMPEAVETGGYMPVMTPELIEEQKGIVWELLRQFGQAITQGRDLTAVSLPIQLFEPRSYLERLTDAWVYGPIFLTRAAETTDPVERMKNVITFAISGLSNTGYPKKPFNPILGETYQATWPDGTRILSEQSSHHPPVTSWQLFGPDNSYHFYGNGEWAASFSGNSISGGQKGTHYVEFKDGTVIEYDLPEVHVRGMIYGDRFFEYEGMMLVRDKKNDLQARIQFKTDLYFPKSGGWFSMRKKVPTDYFKGSITALSDPRKVYSVVEGSWVGAVEFDGKTYWDWKQSLEKAKPIPVDTPLPSDSRYREDLVHLAAGKKEEAGEWKYTLEQKQRADRALRAEGRELRRKQALAAEAKKLGITVEELEARKAANDPKSSWW